ncbi:hypothetical protein [Spirillospora sp. NPDC047279]|uniref:hypothetical protein n=1 Tax=Spirillospora sp. NPDC047279 TaxID=3155478 RepID=UPI0033C75F4C
MTPDGSLNDDPVHDAPMDGERYEDFLAELDEAAGMLGADGQDLASGFIELPAGAYYEIHAFSLAPLAARCAEAPRDRWGSLCLRQIEAWSDNADELARLEKASFDDVRDRLRPHLYSGHAHYRDTAPDDPSEYLRRPLDSGLAQAIVVTGEIDTMVHNGAAAAWGVTADELFAAALANLKEERPTWNKRPIHFPDGEKSTLWRAQARGAASWALLVEAPALFAVPSHHTLIVCPAVHVHAAAAVAEAAAGERGDLLGAAVFTRR